ncbi:MAG: serine/threonine protein kinase [Labilithrix sp.]|nr:serine/threonine protein kinase [Labilithrix sp.]
MDPSQLQPGYRLDRYELLCPLAYGGMASVWLARFGGRLGFERLVVIKMILPQYSQDPRFQEMFLDEARIASKIEHSNVARILDVGEHQENYFIVMEWVDGDSLSKVLRAAEQRKQRVPPGIMMRVIADAAAGLHAAHELRDRDGTHLGVVHRDVSPQNILIANNGATTIIDFGVAKARDRVSQETSAGQLKGKIRYMAPEQALGRAIDHRADVWALGAMLYEMLTGMPPYDGPNEVATLHKLTSGQRPQPLSHSIPEVLRVVVERALAYEPEDRFTTALELNLALEGAMVEINEPTTPALVAHYTGQLLAERKAARKRAVDGALDNARRRDSGQPTSAAHPFPPSTQVFSAPSTPRTFGSIGGGESPSASSGLNGPMSLNEVPSATSSTLGSANMEYFSQPVSDEGPRRRRYLAAAALGVSVAAGVIGAILIVTAVVKDKPASHSSDPPAAVAVTATATTTATVAAPETTAPPDPTGTTAVTSAATTAPSPASPPTAIPSATTPVAHTEPRPTSNANLSHKPPPSAPQPKPTTPTPAPTSTKVDRGF